MAVNVDELIQQGIELQEAQDFIGSLAKFTEIVNAVPEHGQAWYCKANAHAQLNEVEQAIAAYQTSIQHAGDRASLPAYNLGNLYQEIREPEKALACFVKATEVEPTMADAWVNMGRIMDDLGNHEPAIEIYDVAIKLDDQDYVTWSNRGNSLRALGRNEEAIESYRKALALEENDFAGQVGLGVCLVETGEVDPGLKMLEDAIDLTGHPLAIFELATVLGKIDQNSKAVQWFDRALEIGLHSREVFNNRGECLAKLEKIDDSIKSFDRAIEVDPTFAPAYFGKARVLLNADRLDESRVVAENMQETADEEFLASDSVKAMLSILADHS